MNARLAPIVIAWLVAWLAPASVRAAIEPVLEVEFEQTEAVPGQALTLRITVLVPTWMPEPVKFPPLDLPNVRVRLPEKSTTSISRKIDGGTWSGVSRRYLLTPMIAGTFSIPPQTLVVIFADPDNNNAPVEVSVETEPVEFSGVLPPGAEGLDPFIAAKSLVLKQEVEGEPASLKPGDSVRRTLTAIIEGTDPYVLPGLLPVHEIPGIAAYPDEAVVDEKSQRGQISGSRIESVTLMAKGGGSGQAPGVELRWYNIESSEIETASVDGFDVTISGPPVAVTKRIDPVRIALAGGIALAVLVAGWLLWRYAAPWVRRVISNRRKRYLASANWAFGQMMTSIRKQDYPAMRRDLDRWAGRCDAPDPRKDTAVQTALLAIGQARFGSPASGAGRSEWQALECALKNTRHRSSRDDQGESALPELNPGA